MGRRSIGFKGVNHTGFTVSDLERSVAFWQDALGFEVVSVGPLPDETILERITGIAGARGRVAFVKVPGLVVELIEYTAPAERTMAGPPSAVGSGHVALDVQDLDVAVDVAQAHGARLVQPIAIIGPGPFAGTRAAYLRCPDGCTLEFIQAS